MSNGGRGHCLSQDECQVRVSMLHPHIRVLEYSNARTPVLCECTRCGHRWAEPSKNLYRGSDCPNCTKRKKHKWTSDEFFAKITETLPTVEVSGEFTTLKGTRLHCRCLRCGREWESNAGNLLTGHGCDDCAHRYVTSLHRKTHAQFLAEMAKVNPSVEILGEYTSAKEELRCRCITCGHIWEAQPTNLLAGCGCPACRLRRLGDATRKSHEQFVADMHRVHPGITVVSTYTRGADPITLQCDECGEQWTILASSAVAQACGCPTCAGSNGEQAIAAHLREMNIDYQPQKRFEDLRGPGGGMLSYDFYIPSTNTLIEYQGQYHDGTGLYQSQDAYQDQRERDKLKREYAYQHGYHFLEIWYRDFKRIKSILTAHFESLQPTVA